MKLIPKQYQELELIFEAINSHDARCIAFTSTQGEAGVTSLSVSVAKRLCGRNERVLLIDLNSCNPLSVNSYTSMPTALAKWSFGDISCQLNVQTVDEFSFLSITQLQNLDLVREKDVFEMAVLMLKQEFDYILFDTSPVCKKNHANFPLHLLMSVTELLLLNVVVGKTTQETLDSAITELNKAHCQRFEVVVNQLAMPPLGARLIESIERRFTKLPKLKHRLIKLVNKHQWLFNGA